MVIAKGWTFVTLLLAGLFSNSLHAAEVGKADVDRLVNPLIEQHVCKGVVVGTIDETGRHVYGYGVTRDGGAAPDGKTIFEIGSVTKTFTATLLAEMVQSGEVRLDQPVQELLPAGTTVPSKDGAVITLEHLATQRSGLPRMPPDFVPANPLNPYADYTRTMLYESLKQIELTSKPGELASYSNLGLGLLGDALAVKAKKSYEQLIVERICTPLGMNDTRMTLSEEMKSRFAPGYSGALITSTWEFDALAGCGALRSSADDMLKYLAAELALIDVPARLTDAMKLTHVPRANLLGGMRIGLAWVVGQRTGARWHNGQTSGYHAFAAFVPEKKVGVVVLCNSPAGEVDNVGSQLIDAMLGNQLTTAPTTTPSTHTTSSASPRP